MVTKLLYRACKECSSKSLKISGKIIQVYQSYLADQCYNGSQMAFFEENVKPYDHENVISNTRQNIVWKNFLLLCKMIQVYEWQ